MPPPAAWIENCSNNNDVLKHLVSLRCFMLEDALSIQKINKTNEANSDGNEMDRDGSNVDEDSTQPILMEL